MKVKTAAKYAFSSLLAFVATAPPVARAETSTTFFDERSEFEAIVPDRRVHHILLPDGASVRSHKASIDDGQITVLWGGSSSRLSASGSEEWGYEGVLGLEFREPVSAVGFDIAGTWRADGASVIVGLSDGSRLEYDVDDDDAWLPYEKCVEVPADRGDGIICTVVRPDRIFFGITSDVGIVAMTAALGSDDAGPGAGVNSMENLTVAIVPEPSSLLLLSAAMFAGRRRCPTIRTPNKANHGDTEGTEARVVFRAFSRGRS